jgi:hypothetical protein
VNGDEQVRFQPPRDPEPFAQDEVAVVLAGERDAGATARDELVANGPGDPERHVLLPQPGARRDRARIDAAMAGVDHDQRLARLAHDARQPGPPGRGDRLHCLGLGATEGEGKIARPSGLAGCGESGLRNGLQLHPELAPALFEADIADHRRPLQRERNARAAVACGLRNPPHRTRRPASRPRRSVAHLHQDLPRAGRDKTCGMLHRGIEADDDPVVRHAHAFDGRRRCWRG